MNSITKYQNAAREALTELMMATGDSGEAILVLARAIELQKDVVVEIEGEEDPAGAGVIATQYDTLIADLHKLTQYSRRRSL